MKNICVFVGLFGLWAAAALAGDLKQPVPFAAPGPFDRGGWELEGGAGDMLSFSSTSAKRPTINYQMEDLRLGWMYDSPRHEGWWRGNNEFLLETFGGPVTKGPGNYLAGGSLLWRYNFVQPDAKFVPYIQLGGGVLDNDIHNSHPQRELGEAFEFVLQGDIGVKYIINSKWSVSVEADYRHISNADLSSRNQGLNSLGGLMQASYYFH